MADNTPNQNNDVNYRPPAKSYLERYHDIKTLLNNTHNVNNNNRSRPSTPTNHSLNMDPIASTPIEDDESKTLERWDARKERKRAEVSVSPGAALVTSSPVSISGKYKTVLEPTMAMSSANPKSLRWAPANNYYESPEVNTRKDFNQTGGSNKGEVSPLFNDVQLTPTGVDPLSNQNLSQQQSKKSTYAEGLRSFSHTISNSVAADMARDMARDYWGSPKVSLVKEFAPKSSGGEERRCSHDVNNFVHERGQMGHGKQVERGQTHAQGIHEGQWSTNNEPSQQQDGQHDSWPQTKINAPDPIESYYNDNPKEEPEGEERYIGRRICCNLPCRSNNKRDFHEVHTSNDQEVTPFSTKQSSWHIYAALLLCAASVIATAFTVKYVSSEKSASHATFTVGGKRTQHPTVSTQPSTSPSYSPSNEPSSVPSDRPSSQRDVILSEYLELITQGLSNVVGSPQHAAKQFLLHQDSLHLSLPSSESVTLVSSSLQKAVYERINQRYALATMYYAMGIKEGGVLKGWMEGDECMEVGDYEMGWDGVRCEDGVIVGVAIDGANLSGTIPPQISLLHKVQHLIIKNNPNLSGNIPTSIGDKMTNLKQIGLYSNALTGSLPKSILQLEELVYVNVAQNELTGQVYWDGVAFQKSLARVLLHDNNFEGSISFNILSTSNKLTLLGLSNNNFRGSIHSSIGEMTHLEYLYLDGNKLAGRLPDTMGGMSNLISLNLDGNWFDGTLPESIGQMSKLTYLSAKDNKLSGGLPDGSASELKSLKTLNLANNAFSGNIQSLTSLPNLEYIHLYQNSFTGEIPSGLFALSNLKVLFLSSNSFEGSIPSQVSNARRLKGLYLSENMLQGSIPNGACSLTGLEDLFLDANAFSGELPGCFGNLSKLKRFYAFKNQLTGNVPPAILSLPNLVELGIEENDISGGMDGVCTDDFTGGLNIWADCDELEGGCDCCTKCCSDRQSQCD